MVATTEFAEAADAQATALGFKPSIVFVPHPIQNRTAAELVAVAEGAVDAILSEITDPRA